MRPYRHTKWHLLVVQVHSLWYNDISFVSNLHKNAFYAADFKSETQLVMPLSQAVLQVAKVFFPVNGGETNVLYIMKHGQNCRLNNNLRAFARDANGETYKIDFATAAAETTQGYRRVRRSIVAICDECGPPILPV